MANLVMRVETVLFPVLRQIVKRDRLAEAVFGRDSWGNPFSDDQARDPSIAFEAMRKQPPIVHKRMYQQWFVTGYDEARQTLASPEATSSQQADMLLSVPPYNRLNKQGTSFLKNFLVLTDPPVHTRLRGLINRAFTPRQVARLDERMDTIIDSLIDDMMSGPGNTVDPVASFCAPFPVFVIAELLGVPRERWRWITDMSTTMTQLFDPIRGFDLAAMNAAHVEFHDYVTELAGEKRANPQQDLLTGLALAEDHGDRLSTDELVAVFGLVLFAGHETTTGLFGNSLVNLHRFPEQRALIRSKPDLWPNAVEELARFDPPIKADPRAAVQDLNIAGHVIPAGSNIVVLLGAANRDPRRFDRPDELLLDREDPAPLSFGHGIHFCIGANLARMELRKGLSRLLEVLGDYSVDDGATEWKRSLTLRGPTAMTVTPN